MVQFCVTDEAADGNGLDDGQVDDRFENRDVSVMELSVKRGLCGPLERLEDVVGSMAEEISEDCIVLTAEENRVRVRSG